MKEKEMAKRLIDHIAAMKDDDYLVGHPEWLELVKEAENLGEYLSTYEISSNEPRG